MRTILLCALLSINLAAQSPFRLPDGFEATKFAGDELTHDTWAMTISPDGRVAVSGPGYIKVLLDRDGDGVAEADHLVSNEARNPHGLLWSGNDLLSVQPQGIFLHRDRDGDGLPESKPELFYQLPGGGGEHGPHGIRRGPDGWLYVACGNSTRVDKKTINTNTSPVSDPSQGTVLRVSPDGKQSEVIAHGFRNHYDIAFNERGHLFTFDSDGERDHQLPWYSYCRVFHVRVGGHHGWLLPGHQRSFNRPPYFFDSADRLVEIDRGSPTGVEVYRHTSFPSRYRGGLFFACWTYGRIYHVPLKPQADSYHPQQAETFVETTGNLGFAPSDIAVHPPTGDLFIAVGGRGTQGSVYRISYAKGSNAKPLPEYETPAGWSIHQDRITQPDLLTPRDALATFRGSSTPPARMSALRHLMLGLGDISTNEAKRRIDAGYTANRPHAFTADFRATLVQELEKAFDPKSAAEPLHYEIARLLAMLKSERPSSVRALAATLSPQSHPTHDAHYLFCLAQMPGARDATSRDAIANAFMQIDAKLSQRKLLTDRNWSINILDALKAHLQLDPPLAGRLAGISGDRPDPHHAYLLEVLSKDAQIAAAEAMLACPAGWNTKAFHFVQRNLTPARALPLARRQWQHAELRPQLTTLLSQHGTADDQKLVEEFYRPPSGGIDLAPFNEKMKKADWNSGEIARGKAAYARFNCVTCHTGRNRLGPGLKNITRRFNRDDLFLHINEPNLAISDLYKATQIATSDGTYVGVKVYSSEAQTILETGTGETIRFSRHDIISERTPNQSPMPPGLLLSATPQDLADLYAYLKTL